MDKERGVERRRNIVSLSTVAGGEIQSLLFVDVDLLLSFQGTF